MTITFAGHSFVALKDKVKELVKIQIRNNIVGGETVNCYLGGYGDFDEICAYACKELKKENINIKTFYITPYISLSEQAKINEMQRFGLYDASIYPPIENVPPRFAISKRNEWMVSSCDLMIAYVNKNYGGAYKSLQAAKRKGKKIINICDFL